MQTPIPDVDEVGILGWILCVLIGGGVTVITMFLRRMVAAMDRMATAQEQAPVVFAKLEASLDAIDRKLDRVVDLTQEQVTIARLWQKTEAPGRLVKEQE